MKHRLVQRNRAFSLVEVTVILIVVTVLSGLLVPVVSAAVNRSKLVRARTDVAAIKTALLNMLEDVCARGVVQDGTVKLGYQEAVDLLVSDGDIPQPGPEADAEWTQPVDFRQVDFIEYHLSTNRPGNNPDRAYEVWNGSYLGAPIGPDPWGNRYMINVRYLFSGNRYDVVVISAGPDEEIDSRFEQDGFVPGDDDIICLVSSGTVVRKADRSSVRGGRHDRNVRYDSGTRAYTSQEEHHDDTGHEDPR